ncbi:LOW QUALITY PROTEIN: uncharacterized protein [Argopecten irradians]|uniref:LOW QUALITY PROTEIN: uncharacterized protein n=1 Tax=Argopecten irradians TaxID=31199 RepID=UPI00370FEA70
MRSVSRSRSPFMRSRSRSRSPFMWSHSRSRSPFRRRRRRSRSHMRSLSKSRSPFMWSRSRSRSPFMWRQNIRSTRQLQLLRLRLEKPRPISRTRSCPSLQPSRHSCTPDRAPRPRCYSLSPERYQLTKYVPGRRGRTKTRHRRDRRKTLYNRDRGLRSQSPLIWNHSRSQCQSPFIWRRNSITTYRSQRSRSPFDLSRSRSRSPFRRRRSRSRSPFRRSRSRSISPFRRRRSRSISPCRRRRSRSISPFRRRRSRSISPFRRRRSRSISPFRRRRSRSISPFRRRRSRSISPFRQRRSRSISFCRQSIRRSRSLSYSSGSPAALSCRSLSRSCSRSRSPQMFTYRSHSRSRSRSRNWSRLSGYRSRSRSRSRSPIRRFVRRKRVRRRDRCRRKSKDTKTWNIDENVSDFFFSDVSVDEHIKAQNQNRSRYIAGITLLQEKGVELHHRVRVRALAASWVRKDFRLSSDFLRDRDHYGVAEILKALEILDSSRRIRQKEKTLKRLQLSSKKVSHHTTEHLKGKIHNLRKIQPRHGAANLSVCKNIRKWTKTLTKEELERYALHLPKEPWKKLADICHFNPVDDFPNLPWFLPFCFGKPAPDGTVVHSCGDLNKTNINEKLKTYDIPYSHCKKLTRYMNVESKIKIATSEPRLDTVLWYYENLECRQVDEVIMTRLDTGDTTELSIGKLMDRLLTFKQMARGFRCGRRKVAKYKIPFLNTLLSLAEAKLRDVKEKLHLDAPVVVVGDRSGSMDIAVRTSSVIAGILCSVCSADMLVFNHRSKRPKVVPTNVDEAIKLAMKTMAHGSTNPSSALKPFYKRKRVVKTFIIVTDEDETDGDFAELFEKYHAEVFPAQLVFVSFLDQHQEGFMCKNLTRKGFKPLQFVLNRTRPDLTKLEKILGILASGSSSFNEELSVLQHQTCGNHLTVDS